MSFLDISTIQPCSQKFAYAICTHPYFCKKFDYGKQTRWPFSWKSVSVPGKSESFNSGKIEVLRGGLVITAVASFKCTEVGEVPEPLCGYLNLRLGFDSSCSTPTTTEQLSTIEDYAELDEREKLRRMRISKANKGNTPWNKGKKHNAETLQRIKERTRLAMQDPKVKMKLVTLGHAQSAETRVKIGLGVRIGWEKRREKLMLQETCYYEWQNLIADASNKGLLGEEELQWDSYAILNEQLEEECLLTVKQRKQRKRPNGSKRPPKSEERRGKISDAISAKWADPRYRTRVCSAMEKVHGMPEGVVRKPRKRSTGDGEPRKSVPKNNADVDADEHVKLESRSKGQIEQVKMRKTNAPLFNDPLSRSKLDMLKNIRAERAAAENKKVEAVARAKALISESVKALNALEAAAETSPLSQASFVETRKLIAEAKQLMKSIEKAELASSDLIVYSVEEDLDESDPREVNGSKFLGTSASSIGKKSLTVSSTDNDLLAEEVNNMIEHSTFERHLGAAVNGSIQNVELPLTNKIRARPEGNKPHSSMNTTKKWVRGRLVEVVEAS